MRYGTEGFFLSIFFQSNLIDSHINVYLKACTLTCRSFLFNAQHLQRSTTIPLGKAWLWIVTNRRLSDNLVFSCKP
ncbi:Predicted protein [Komagataella phaffii CBS 7435]|nr:Predicted protein [Komagataella phaffii CBS 7435]